MTRIYLATAVLCLAGGALAGLAAQEAPVGIYPVYEGYTENEDGSYTLVFGYYNGSPAPVDLPAGTANRFAPEPADRGQPTLFLPGRQRNVCRLVVPAGFTGNLEWRLTYEGTETKTTEHGGVDELYLLEEIGLAYRAAREIDLKEAPRGVCINGAPMVRLGRDVEARVGEKVQLGGYVQDDGLPRGGALTVQWSLVDGPEGVELGEATSVATTATFAVAGTYRLKLTASDSELTREDELTVTVVD